MITVKVYRIDIIAEAEFHCAQPSAVSAGPLHVPGGAKQQPYRTFTCKKMRVEDNKQRHFVVYDWRDYTEEELDQDNPFQNSGEYEIAGTYSRKIFAYSMERDDDSKDIQKG